MTPPFDPSLAYFEPVPSSPGVNRLEHNTCGIIDFELLVLAAGEKYEFQTGGREFGIAILTGTASVQVGGERFGPLGGRVSVFTAPPSGVYAGCGSKVVIEAHDAVEIGVGSALSKTPIAPYAITPENCKMGHWGEGNTLRHFRYLINDERPSERLWFTEVIVRDGRWATFPPHKHEDVPGDLFQEEMYFYKTDPAHGFGFCGQFGGLMEKDYAFLIQNNTIHKMPHGYHTVTAAPGCQVYYLAVYAGRDKGHRPSPHPQLASIQSNPMPDPFL
jgi:5-deoxy-glucuronate isomerase